ncbi:hypothetical protein PSTG_15727 [Puccinia striiformis f. sp. tritici PST-78]|uniref:RING-type domain-containing protein n=1 Tax=Puccinia striiformis f. sp. tritici PST-78 TaxID=1165861 RepID=A0A0L0UUV5_9BASI|nr:hypothetical protein PSTG_15727 [Puccinia striiformis f. sp. tritici PST-78]
MQLGRKILIMMIVEFIHHISHAGSARIHKRGLTNDPEVAYRDAETAYDTSEPVNHDLEVVPRDFGVGERVASVPQMSEPPRAGLIDWDKFPIVKYSTQRSPHEQVIEIPDNSISTSRQETAKDRTGIMERFKAVQNWKADLMQSLKRRLPHDVKMSREILFNGVRLPGDTDACSICLADYQDDEKGALLRVFPGCNHRFHKGCLEEWLAKRLTCPICRLEAPKLPSIHRKTIMKASAMLIYYCIELHHGWKHYDAHGTCPLPLIFDYMPHL